MKNLISKIWSEFHSRVFINWGSTLIGVATVIAGLNASDSWPTKAGIVLAGSLGVLSKNVTVK